MKKYIHYFGGISISFIAITTFIFASEDIFQDFGFNNDDAMCSGKICPDNDLWNFNVSNILIFDSDRSGYDNDLRGLLQGKIISKLFGAFEIISKDNGSVGLKLKFLAENGMCGSDQHTYTVEGSIKSTYFGQLDTVPEYSYFCPGSLESLITFSSPTLPKKIVLSSKFQNNENYVENDPNTVVFDGATTENVFEKQQVLILGNAKLQGDVNALLSESGKRDINEINTSGSINPAVRSQIDQKIAELKRNVSPIAVPEEFIEIVLNDLNSIPSVTTSGEDIFYYNLEGKALSSDNGYGNKGLIVKLQKSSLGFNGDEPRSYTLEIDKRKTLIVEGGNIYINADLYNNNSLSLLTIISKRGKNGQGGNIYIDPDVTNIDAVLVADGSLLSYREGEARNGGDILNRAEDNNDGLLARQLYIYGAILTRNVLGSENIPLESDVDLFNIPYSPTIKNNIYNLANLRGFQTRFAAPDKGLQDCGQGLAGKEKWYITTGYVVEGDTNEEKLEEIKPYAWAGKMECFNSQIDDLSSDDTAKGVATPVSGLRTIGKKNSIIIEYNPAIKENMPFILRSE